MSNKMLTLMILMWICFLTLWMLAACAPTEGYNSTSGSAQPEQGVPTIVIEKRAIYDRSDNFIGYRYYDSELAQYCYEINGDLSCPTR